jgi:hypothetical protein
MCGDENGERSKGEPKEDAFSRVMLTINVSLMTEKSLYIIAHRHVQRVEALTA